LDPQKTAKNDFHLNVDCNSTLGDD